MFVALGAFAYRFRWAVLFAALVFLGAAVAVLVHGGKLTAGQISGIEATRAKALVDAVTGRGDGTVVVVLTARDGLSGGDPAFLEAVRTALAPLHDDPRVASVVSPADLPPPFAARMLDARGGAAQAMFTLQGDFQTALAAYPDVRARLTSDRLAIHCTGQIPFMHDLDATLKHDLMRAEIASIPLALLVLAFVFRTAVAALLPVCVGGLAVVGGVAAVLLLSHRLDMAQYTINVCSLIGLGVAIDYSLFFVSRYREELAGGRSHRDALLRAMDTAGRVVAFSGAAVTTGLAGLFFFEGSYLRSMGIGGVVVVALAVLFALTVLPALLAALGPRIDAGRLPLPALGKGGMWHAVATRVMRRPLLYLVPALGVLLAMGTPFLRLRLSAADVRVLPTTEEARQGYDLLREHFPDAAATRFSVAVQFPSRPAITPPRAAALADLEQRLERIPHVVKIESPLTGALVPVGDDAVVLYALSDAPPDSDAARAVVRAIRQDRRVADGALLVGGETANDVDSTDYILARAPVAVGFVVGATLLVIFSLLGSVLLPIKAVVMNFVSIAGSFGALVWVFQEGHLLVSEPRPIEPSLPVLLFCALFGLSMDYEVLLLSRIKEVWERTHDNTAAVAQGLERSAGLITSAAAIMISVFGAFALARIVLIQAVGFGMALAVALDATLVRVILVPATMRLFGHLNWWMPASLARLRRAVGLDRVHRSE